MRAGTNVFKVAQYCVIAFIAVSMACCIPSKRQLPSVLAEASGLAIKSDTLLVINDSGNFSTLYEVTPRNKVIEVPIPFDNIDWEALAQYKDGSLCICDIGDNRRTRDDIRFIFPAKASDRSVTRTYPGRAENAEACYIYNHELYLLTKAEAGRKDSQKKAYLYRVDTAAAGANKLRLIDSLVLKSRVVTDAVFDQKAQQLRILSYNYNIVMGIAPITRTSMWSISLKEDGGFRQNTLQERKVKAPLTLTQYEAIGVLNDGNLLLLSEKTLSIKPRRRILKL